MSGQLASRSKKKFKFSGGFRKRRAIEIKNRIKSYSDLKCIKKVSQSIDDSSDSTATDEYCRSDSEKEDVGDFELQFSDVSCEESDKKATEFNYEVFAHELAQWALKNNIKHEQLKGLLHLWNDLVPLKSLPSDPRTLLQTPREVGKSGESYWHHGLRQCLSKSLRNITNCPECLSLRFNLDGIPLSKSSSVDCWPILVDICELRSVPPSIVGIYCGKSEHRTTLCFSYIENQTAF